MNKIIKYLKTLIYPITLIIVLPLLLSILNLIGLKTNKIILLIIFIIIMFISGYKLGKISISKGYLNGLIYGIITTSILLILSLIFTKIKIITIIYYIILILSSTIGSMIGIQKSSE